jgi:RNA-directed DNA polymerase
MLERAKEASRDGKYTYVEYARFADDLVILIDAYKRHANSDSIRPGIPI